MAGRWTRLRRFTRFSLRTFVLLLLLLGAAGALWRQWEPWVEVAVLGGDLKGPVHFVFSEEGKQFLSTFDTDLPIQTVRVFERPSYAKICEFEWRNRKPLTTGIQIINNTWISISSLQEGTIVELATGLKVFDVVDESVKSIENSSKVLLQKLGGTYRFLDLRSGKLSPSILHPECEIFYTEVSRDGSRLYTLEPYNENAGEKTQWAGKIIVWDSATAKQVGLIEAPNSGVTKFHMDHEGKRLVVEFQNLDELKTFVALWDLDRSSFIHECEGELGQIAWPGFFFNSPWYLVDTSPTTTEMRNKGDGARVLSTGISPDSGLALSPDHHFLVSINKQDFAPLDDRDLVLWQVQIWNLQSCTLSSQFTLPLNGGNGTPRISYGHSPNYLLIQHHGGSQIWNISNQKPFMVHKSEFSYNLVLLWGSRALHWNRNSKDIDIVRLDASELITTISTPTECVGLDLIPGDGESFVTCHADGTARVWERRRDEGTAGLFALPSLWLTALFFTAFFWSAFRDVKDLKSA